MKNSQKGLLSRVFHSLMIISMLLTATPALTVQAGEQLGSVVVTIQATLTVDGKAPSGQRFDFNLKENHNVKETVQNNSRGKIIFAHLSFTSAGTYRYTIYQVPDIDDTDYIYDKSEYEVEIVITQGETQLDAAVHYYILKDDGSRGEAVDGVPCFSVLTNPVAVNLGAVTKLNGAVPVAGGFSCALYGVNDTKIETKANDAVGAIHFSEQPFSTPDTYLYHIKVDDKSLPFIIYDETEYEAEIIITRNETQLDAAVQYYILKEDGSRGEAVDGLPCFANLTMGTNDWDGGPEFILTDESGTILGTWELDEDNEWIFFPNAVSSPEIPPETGDKMQLSLYLGLLLASVFTAFVVFTKKNRQLNK